MILLSKVDKMEYFFTFTITRTVVTLNADQPVDTVTITTNPFQVAENDQRSMRMYFDEVVNQNIPQGMVLVNYGDPQRFNSLLGIRPLSGNYNLNLVSVKWFIRNESPTYLHPGRPGRTHFAFMINVVVRQRAPL